MSTDICAALENLLFRLDATTDRTGPVPAWVDSYYAARAVLEAQPRKEGAGTKSIPIRPLLGSGYEPGDGSADGAQLIDDEWWHPIMGCDSLQIVIDNTRAAVAQPIGGSPLPTNYIDPEHQGEDLELLQTFYQACQSEGGTADEICLRGIRAVLARRGRPAAAPVAPERRG